MNEGVICLYIKSKHGPVFLGLPQPFHCQVTPSHGSRLVSSSRCPHALPKVQIHAFLCADLRVRNDLYLSSFQPNTPFFQHVFRSNLKPHSLLGTSLFSKIIFSLFSINGIKTRSCCYLHMILKNQTNREPEGQMTCHTVWFSFSCYCNLVSFKNNGFESSYHQSDQHNADQVVHDH